MRSTIPLDVVVAMQQKAPAASEKGAKTGVVDLLKARYAEGGMNAIFSFSYVPLFVFRISLNIYKPT